MKSPFIRSVRDAPARQRAANASALSAIALGVVGVMLGTGVATTAMGVSDGTTWLADSGSGEVLQYNPGTKRVERSYQVGRPGDDISVSQDSGMVALRNERTGEVITVDMSRLRAAGARAAGGPSKVLVAKGMMVLVDRDRGLLRRIDPVKTTDLGHTWQSPVPVADAVADQQGTVWVMVADGHLRSLAWNDQKQGFDQTSETRIQRVADDGLLAAHPTGVTVFGPRSGVIAQVGTSNDSYRQSNQMVGIAPQATAGPADLVAGALANSASVVMIDRGQVRQVSTAELGCARPVNPAAFNGRVYVVCQGNSKVIQLRRDGRVAGPHISTPGSADAQPVADEGRLVLNVSGAREGIEIDRSGTDERFTRTSEAPAPTLRVESKPTNEGIEIGRDQARSDLAVEPLPDQPDSGSGNVNTSPEGLQDRTEVVEDGSSPSATPSEEVPLPEAPVETPESPAGEPAPHPAPAPRASDRAPKPRAEAAPSVGVPRENSAPTVDASSESGAPTPTRSGHSDPSTSASALTGSLAASTSSAVEREPSASPSGPIPTPTETAPAAKIAASTADPTGTAAVATDTPTVRAQGSGPATEAVTAIPAPTAARTATPTPTSAIPVDATNSPAASTPAPTTPAALAAPAGLAAKANGSAVTVTWAYAGGADGFRVDVGGRTVQVVQSARTATVTGNDPGTKKVTVTAVRGNSSRSAETTVTVGAPATTPIRATPTGAVNTPLEPTDSPSRSTPRATPTPTPTPSESAGVPAAPVKPS